MHRMENRLRCLVLAILILLQCVHVGAAACTSGDETNFLAVAEMCLDEPGEINGSMTANGIESGIDFQGDEAALLPDISLPALAILSDRRTPAGAAILDLYLQQPQRPPCISA